MFFVYPLRVIIVTTFSVAMLCAEGDTQGKPRESTGGPDVVCVTDEYINFHMDKLMRWVVETHMD